MEMISLIARRPSLPIPIDTDRDEIENNTDTDDDNDSMDETWITANGLDPLDDGSINIDNGPNGDIYGDGFLTCKSTWQVQACSAYVICTYPSKKNNNNDPVYLPLSFLPKYHVSPI